MKKIFILFFTLCTLSFAIADFEGINWGDSKSDLNIIFNSLEKEPALEENVEIFSVNTPKDFVAKYQFFLKNNSLYKIRVVFDKENVGKSQIQDIYSRLLKDIGSPISKVPINKKIDDLTIQGNSLKFIPNLSTNLYLNGVDTIDEYGKMIDSNLYLEYVDSNIDNNM